MKKLTLVFICIFIFMLAGCQAQLDPSNSKVDSSQTTPDSAPNPGSTSEGDPVNTNADTDQADEKDSAGTDPIHEGDPANNDTDPNQTDDKNDPGTDTSSGDDLVGAPTLPEEIQGEVNLNGNDTSGAVTVVTQTGERKLKNEGSLRGEIEVTHKLSVGKMELSEGETVLFHIETKSAGTELKITLTGAETGTVLEGSVTGSGDISFEINTADEYTVVLENCSLRGVQFTIDYSIGGSK